MNHPNTSARYIDDWLDLVAPENKEIYLTSAEIIAGDHDPVVMVGSVKVDTSLADRFTYRFEGTIPDISYAVEQVSRVRRVRYESNRLFRILGKDTQGREWNLGWTKPTSYEESDGVWTVQGQCEGVAGGDIEGAPSFNGAEVMFLVPPELQLGELMTTVHQTNDDVAEFGHTVSVDGRDVVFRYQPSKHRLFVAANATETLTHPHLSSTLGEPLRILFGQLLYPRLVTKTFAKGHSHVLIQRTHGFSSDTCFVALWPYNQSMPNRNKFWQLYGQLFKVTGDEGPKQDIFAAHTITRLYEEVIQAARGTRWVMALTLASACEALAKRLEHAVPQAEPELLKEIEEMVAHIDKGPKNERLRSTVKGALKRVIEVTTTKILRELQRQGRVKQEDVNAWNSIRNHVMHGNLVLPWSDENEDGKLVALASLLRTLTREAVLPKV